MRATFKILTILFWFTTIGQVAAQTIHSICYIHKVKSQNDKFFFKTIPFDNIDQTSTGKTIVYNSDSTKVYEIERHFELLENNKEIFLSNDGKNIAYVIDKEFIWNGVQNKSIEIFNNGISIKQFQLTDLLDCNSDKEDCYLFYKEAIDSVFYKNGKRNFIFKEKATDFEKQLTEKATFLNNDTLYIFTKTDKLISIDLRTASLSFTPISKINPERFKQIKPFQVSKANLKQPSLFGLPHLSTGVTLEKGLAETLVMAVFPKDQIASKQFKRYAANVQIIVDKNGKAILDKIENYNGFPEDKVKTFIQSQKFATNSIPAEAEKWRFSGWLIFMNKNKEEAEREKQREAILEAEAYKKRIVADSINRIYIPKNLEECFAELNRILKPKDIEAIKNLKDRNGTILYHHGFGTWLRNNWGLWGGSRLQQYLLKKGISYPDSMSSTILIYYYDWLNGQNDKWKEFETK